MGLDRLTGVIGMTLWEGMAAGVGEGSLIWGTARQGCFGVRDVSAITWLGNGVISLLLY